MEVVAKLGLVLGLSFIAGVNLYATIAVVGICVKYHLIQGLPPDFHLLANSAVISIALVLYFLEFLIDKVPGLDMAWDSLHTFIRPLGGALLALMQVEATSPIMEIIVFMLGAGLASTAHFAKAGTRLVINTSPEPPSNMLVSTVEDLGVVGFSYLSLAHPKISFFLTLLCVGGIGMLAPLILRTIRMLLAALYFRIKCALRRDSAWAAARTVPLPFERFFDHCKEPDEHVFWTGRGYAIRVPGIARSTPVQVIISSKTVRFLYRRRFRMGEKELSFGELLHEKLYPGLLLSRWLLRTTHGEWLLHLDQPISATLPQHLPMSDKANENSF